jgi:phosphonate transport system substrate-binding protein
MFKTGDVQNVPHAVLAAACLEASEKPIPSCVPSGFNLKLHSFVACHERISCTDFLQRLGLSRSFFCLPQASQRVQDQRLAFFCSAIPSQDLDANLIRFRPFVAYLERKLGVPVRCVVTSSYEETVEVFGRHDVHLAWLGGLTGIQARLLSPGAEAIAQGAEDANFRSYFIANAQSGLVHSLDFPEALKGKSFTFGSQVSTSGRLIPEYYIRQHFNDLVPEQIFSRVGFSGAHDKTLAAVQSGQFDAGAMDYLIFETKRKAGRVDESKVRVIWETPPYPDNQFTVQGGLDEVFGKGFKEKVKQAIIELDDKVILRLFGRSKFVATSQC